MGNKLHKLGLFAYKHGLFMIAGWAVVLLVLAITAGTFMKPTSGSISIPGTEAQKAIDRMGELFPDAGKGSGRVVIAAPAGKTINDYQTQIDEAAAKIRKVKDVVAVITPFYNPSALSKDKTIGYMQVQLKGENGSINESTLVEVEKTVDETRKNGLTVEMGGDLINKAPGEILGLGEIIGVVLALLVLVMTLGSLIAAGMPVLTAVIAVGVSMAGLFSLSHLITIGTTTPVLAVMLGLAVGIDYSLFIISKYRTYALQGYSYPNAAARAIGTAGNAVIFAAATVVIALSALAVVQIPFMTTMGLSGAATIAIAALVAVTLIPGLLGLVGKRIFTGKTRRMIEAAQKQGVQKEKRVSHQTFWYKWGRAITKWPAVVLVVAVAIVATIALPVRDLTLGLPTDEFAAKDSTERKAYELLARGFGAGFNGPLLIVAEGLPAVSDTDKAGVRDAAMQQYNQQVAQATREQEALFQQKAAQVTNMEQAAALQQEIAMAKIQGEKKQQEALAEIDKQVDQYAKLVQLKKVADKIGALDNVQQAVPAVATTDGTKGLIQIIPKSAPSDKKTGELISHLRDSGRQKELTSGILAVTGSTALQNDINDKLNAALPLYLGVVVGLSLLLLIIAFRSILVPLKATLGFLLSVFAMFGALVAVFEWGWFGIAEAPGPIVSFIPIIAIGILFGLAMDYEFFLVSSMHEAYQHEGDAKKAVVDGFGLGSKVVTAAGVIMIAVFAGFITNHDATVQAIGFGLAIGIFIDAFIVRMTIVPAVMALLGKSAWWLPKWLDKIIPHVSIEGEAAKK